MLTITETTTKQGSVNRPVTTYHEVMVGKTLFRVTSVYRGTVDLRQALEDLAVSRALHLPQKNTGAQG